MAKQNEIGVLVKDNFEQHAQHVDKATKSYNNFGTAVTQALNKSKLLGFIGALKETVNAMTNASKAEAEYIESMNLLKVAYKDNTDSADKLINKMKDMYGLDPAGLTKTLGIYKQMTSAMGMTNETSALLSENLLKMQEDVASLYNLDFETVGKKFQSALAGQSRALYSLGVDITKTSLQQELYNMGIERNINELNKASKTALTYIVMEKQLQNAYGDASKTINSLANQTKIWQEQTAIAARQIKALVIPVLQLIISYANGIIMAFNAVMETILSFFGVDVDKMASEFSIASNDISVGIGDIGSAATDAGKAVDKLKLGLRGFDKLNVITTPTDSGSSGGGGGAGGGAGGGIDPNIAKHLKEYNLKDAANNAAKIRDAILEWLHIFNPLGESLKKLAGLAWDGIIYLWENVLVPMGKWAKETFLPTLVKTLASALDAVYNVALTMKPVLKWIMENVVIPFGQRLGKVVVNLLKNIKNAFDLISKSKLLQYLIGSTGLLIALSKLVGVAKDVYAWFGKTKLGGILTTYNGLLLQSIKETKSLADGISQYFDLIVNEGAKTSKSLMGLQINVDALKAAISGAIQTALGISMIQAAIQNIQEENANLMDVVLLVAGAFEVVMGAIELFTGVWGVLKTLVLTSNPFALIVTAIVGTAGFIWAMTQADEKIDGTVNQFAKLDDAEANNIKSHENQMKSAQELSKELEGLMDSTGKVKKEDEEYVSYILNELNSAYGTNYKLTDGQITKNGKLVTSYQQIEKEIENYMKKVNAQYLLEKLKDKYNEALDKHYEKQQKINAVTDVYEDELNKLKIKYGENYEAEEKYHKEAEVLNETKLKTLDKIKDEYKNTEELYEKYSDLTKAIAKGDMEEINKKYEDLMKITVGNSNNYAQEYAKTFENAIETAAAHSKSYIENKLGDYGTGYAAGNKVGKGYIDAVQKDFNNTTFKLKGKMTVTTNLPDGTANFYSQKAEGGFLNKGEIFVAREAGPEMVGTINGKTAVANNDQIVEAISIGVAKAMSGRNTNVTIQANANTQGLLNFIDFKQQQKNRQYGL